MEPAAHQRFSRPVYEGLPWFYIAFGLAALAGSYLMPSGVLSLIVSLAGLGAAPGGAAPPPRPRAPPALSNE